MPLVFLAMYSYWLKALKPVNQNPSVIVLLPEEAPELATTGTEAGYQG